MNGMPGMQMRQSIETPFFDAKIEGRNPQLLTLTIRVSLHPIPDIGSTDRSFSQIDNGVTRQFPVRAWTEPEWALFRLEFARVLTRYWSSKFVIHYPYYPKNIPPFSPRPVAAAASPEIKDGYLCKLQVVASDQSPHLTAAVVRFTGGVLGPVSWAVREQRRALITQRGIEFRERPGRPGLYHNTAAHELGHFLGLEHEGKGHPGCVQGSEQVCYEPTPEKGQRTMGLGSKMTPHYAKPWLDALHQMSMQGIPSRVVQLDLLQQAMLTLPMGAALL